MPRTAVRAAVLALLALGLALLAAPSASLAAGFEVGASSVPYTPPLAGQLANDPSDCLKPAQAAFFDGPRKFAFEEPYRDSQGTGHYDAADPFLDCNANGRWDGNFLGGGSDSPRFYDHVADDVGARAMVVSNGTRTIAVEVLDNEGAFNVYLDRIRQRVEADGYHLDGIYISSNHDESAPDTIGISGVSAPVADQSVTSSTNDYFADYMVKRSALAIEHAYDNLTPATVSYADAREPANLRQCWSSYPFTDDPIMPTLQAVDSSGHAIVTLADVSQHAESLGFNPDPVQKDWISSDWINFFRNRLEARYGGVAIEMAGSVGSVETPEVFSSPVSATPQQFVSESHPAGCRTIFNAPGDHVPLGYDQETKALGESLADAVSSAVDSSATASASTEVWGRHTSVCLPVDNGLFLVGGLAGVFATRPGYTADCTVRVPPLPNGTTTANEIQSDVAAFQIGDGTFVSVPGEVFPFTYLRGFQGPADMPHAKYALSPWLMPHLHTPYRFIDGLGEDMVGYIFPRGNDVGVPGTTNLDPSSTDRFGCGHSDDSEAVSGRSGNIIGRALVGLLRGHGGPREQVAVGRYVMPDGTLSRDPLGGPEVKCATDQTFNPEGPATAVFVKGEGQVTPTQWMALDGTPQTVPDRTTRGFFDSSGDRIWLNVYPRLGG